MSHHRTTRTALTPGVRNAYDQYAPVFKHLVRLTRELTSAPLEDMIAANLHMEITGTRYDVATGRHHPLEEADRDALQSHRRFFEMLARFGADYRQFRSLTAGGVDCDPDSGTGA